MPISTRSVELNIHPILGALRSVPVPPHPQRAATAIAAPFVTLSRQPAIDADGVANLLVERLNQPPSAEPRRWTCWDRELVEAVAAREHLSPELVESLEDANPSWLTDFFSSLSFTDATTADEARIYRRVTTMIRALAQAGRVVIIGRAAAQVTRQMPGGIHVRLVAPFEHRLARFMQHTQLPRSAATARLHELDHNRQAFYRRYWAQDPPTCERFAVTLNAAELSQQTMADVIHTVVAGTHSVPQG